MAIQFARIERVKRSGGKNACCKGAYNARTNITDQKTNITYNFSNRLDNVYHQILLPEYVDQKFKNLSELMNAVEHIERKGNSQLLKEYVLALPDEDNVSLEVKIEMVHEFIHRNKWIQEGLAVQIDIHEPHEHEKNWHAQRILANMREKSSKHAWGVIIEVSMWGTGRSSKTVENEWRWRGQRRCFTRVAA